MRTESESIRTLVARINAEFAARQVVDFHFAALDGSAVMAGTAIIPFDAADRSAFYAFALAFAGRPARARIAECRPRKRASGGPNGSAGYSEACGIWN